MIVFILWVLLSIRNWTLVLLRSAQRRESTGSDNLGADIARCAPLLARLSYGEDVPPFPAAAAVSGIRGYAPQRWVRIPFVGRLLGGFGPGGKSSSFPGTGFAPLNSRRGGEFRKESTNR